MATTYYVNTVFSAGDRMTPALSRMSAAVKGFEDRAKSSAKSIGGTFSGGVAQATAALGAAGLSGMMAKAITSGAELEQVLVTAGQRMETPILRGTAAFQELLDVSKKIGATTQFSALDAAGALESLAASGYTSANAIAVLPTITNMAAAAGLSLADATSMSSDALNAMGMASSNAATNAANLTRVSDMMVKGADMANQTFTDVFEVMTKAGAAATSLGTPMSQLVAASASLANRGIKAEQAGTGLKSVLTKLVKPAADAQAEMKKMGFALQLTDTGGLDLAKSMELLKQKTEKMTQVERGRVIATIFGLETTAAATSLLAGAGAEMSNFAAQAEGATGSTQRIAAALKDTTQGAIMQAKAALEGLFLSLYEKMPGAEGGIKKLSAAVSSSGNLVWGLVQVLGFLAGATVVAKVATLAFHVAQVALGVTLFAVKAVTWLAVAAWDALTFAVNLGKASTWKFYWAMTAATLAVWAQNAAAAATQVVIWAIGVAALYASGGFWAVAGAVWAAIGPFVIVVLVIGAIIGAMVLLYQNSETVRSVVDTVWGAIKTAITSAIDFVMGPINWLLDAFGLISSGLSDMQNAAGSVGASMGDLPQSPFLDGGSMTLATDGGPDIGGQLAGASPGNAGATGFAGTLDMSLVAPAGYGMTTAAKLPPGINVQQAKTGGF